MKTYAFDALTSKLLAEIATIRHEPSQPELWEELRGDADGALAPSVDEEVGLPYLVVMEAKRGTSGTDPMAQLLGAMLCAAWLNEEGGHTTPEVFGCYTIADVWTFVRGKPDFGQARPAMGMTVSREYTEKTEAASILAILESIVGMYQE